MSLPCCDISSYENLLILFFNRSLTLRCKTDVVLISSDESSKTIELLINASTLSLLPYLDLLVNKV